MHERWPWLLREIAERMGADAALKLVAHYGGQIISVPRDPKGSAIERELGAEMAAMIVDLRGGEDVEVPNLGYRLAEERRRFILTHPELSANDCARKLGITNRRVKQIRQEARPDPAQIDMFEIG